MQGLKSLCYNMNYSLTPHIIFESFFRVVTMALSANLIALLEAILLFGKYQIDQSNNNESVLGFFFSLHQQRRGQRVVKKQSYHFDGQRGQNLIAECRSYKPMC